MKIIEGLKILILLPVLLIVVLLVIVSKIFENKIERTSDEIESILNEMASGNADEDLWYDFLSISIKDKKLDNIRERTEILWAYEEFQM